MTGYAGRSQAQSCVCSYSCSLFFNSFAPVSVQDSSQTIGLLVKFILLLYFVFVLSVPSSDLLRSTLELLCLFTPAFLRTCSFSHCGKSFHRQWARGPSCISNIARNRTLAPAGGAEALRGLEGWGLVLTWRFMIWTEVYWREKSTRIDRFRHSGCLNNFRSGGSRGGVGRRKLHLNKL